jgi:diguanylate cyclase (GGDEF)-like protein/putative nucleotidyltransferase with HDIG domain
MTRGRAAARAYAGGALAVACLVLAAAAAISVLWLVPLAALGVYLAYQAHRLRLDDERRHAQRMSELHLATVEALALAIDAKDQTAPNHVRRVQAFATGLARALGMSEHEVQGVLTAALLHDIGKLAVPEHILAKPGPLTQEEFQKVRTHPQVGADIIASVPFPYPVTPLVLSHHERWDGRGYPSGLRENEIPLGARILCTVDYYDALTSDRPYHRGISADAAVALIQQEAGKALDPRVVDTFIRILPELQRVADAIEAQGPHAPASLQMGEGARTLAAGTVADRAKASVFDDIAVAHREIYALYQIAQAMGTSLGVSDTMTLISSKLDDLVPFSACGLFLYAHSTETVQCRFATGTDSELLQQLTLRSGQGLNGWVVRNRRPLVNARPGADLEAMGSKAPTVLQSALVCPLIVGERLIGTLAVYHTEASFYTDDHRRLLDRVCEQGAAVIQNAVLFEQTQEDSLTDPLTSLPNTRSMFQRLARELARAERLGAEVALLVLDLNDFKEINDTWGHHMGDRALQGVATTLRAAIRPYDMCVRYAGDEFIVVMTGCGHEEAENRRNELQRGVQALVFEPRAGHRVPLSIAAGVAVFPHDGDSYEALLAKADSRMYQDKSARKTDTSRQLSDGTASTRPAPEPERDAAPSGMF